MFSNTLFTIVLLALCAHDSPELLFATLPTRLDITATVSLSDISRFGSTDSQVYSLYQQQRAEGVRTARLAHHPQFSAENRWPEGTYEDGGASSPVA
ncbi:uncharacterized protein F4812DRAFT_456005 [Daldinia caldariorum]|uniref:uncharacterized protein n=1 Tax=Daldinia caldariorum TaxID=326644 RepID=UPI00200803D7|nr:uncharacterized protein F4812DRAFT_456005 [Daldinia caldariorum]KAI1471902.1 hypothetical protein F4812DRAFT_456005 [Daldinia caldariorum]